MEGEPQGCVGVRERDGQLDCSYCTSNLNDPNCRNADARGPEWCLDGILSMRVCTCAAGNLGAEAEIEYGGGAARRRPTLKAICGMDGRAFINKPPNAPMPRRPTPRRRPRLARLVVVARALLFDSISPALLFVGGDVDRRARLLYI